MVKQQEIKTEVAKKKAEEMSIKATKEEIKSIKEEEKSSKTVVRNKVEKSESAVLAAAGTWERNVAEKQKTW
jgi:hypothetical protein